MFASSSSSSDDDDEGGNYASQFPIHDLCDSGENLELLRKALTFPVKKESFPIVS